MPLENRNLEMGTVLRARYKGKERTCEVVQADDGLRYRLDDGTEHKSPSAAAKQAVGGIAANGWRFWSLEEVRKGAAEPKAKRGPKTKATTEKPAQPKSAKKGRAKKAKVQSAKSRSDAYGCGACGETFPTMKAATQHATEAHLS